VAQKSTTIDHFEKKAATYFTSQCNNMLKCGWIYSDDFITNIAVSPGKNNLQISEYLVKL